MLLEVLPEGPKEIKRQAEEAGIHWSTVRRAKELLRVEACREGGIASQGRWIWRLTRKPKVPIPEFEHLSNLSEEKWRKTPKVPKVPKVEDEHLSEPLMDEYGLSREEAEAQAPKDPYGHLDEATRALYHDIGDNIPPHCDVRRRGSS